MARTTFSGPVASTNGFEGNFVPAAVATAENGAGAIGTGAPTTTTRWTEAGVIITQISFDITGFGVLGTAADEVVGLVAGGSAYLGQNVVATNGVIYKAELSCIVVPAQGTATITQDLDISTAAAVLAKDGDGTSARLINTGALVAGETVANLAPAMTDTHYYYLVAAATAATTGVYSAGQFILTTYGHPLLT
jgi:hypothetical protein